MTTEPTLQLQSISFAFGSRQVLRGIDLAVQPGEIFGLLGANGSGKTSLLRLIAGALLPDSGTLSLTGSTGYVSQKFGLYEDLRVEENLTFSARCYGLNGSALRQAVDNSLERFGLTPHRRRRTSELSHGWKQRIALAAALCHQPRVLILDEATAGLDTSSRLHLWQLLAQTAATGVAVLSATHDLDEASRCHRLGHLHEGRLLFSAPPAELFTQAAARLHRPPASLAETLSTLIPAELA